MQDKGLDEEPGESLATVRLLGEGFETVVPVEVARQVPILATALEQEPDAQMLPLPGVPARLWTLLLQMYLEPHAAPGAQVTMTVPPGRLRADAVEDMATTDDALFIRAVAAEPSLELAQLAYTADLLGLERLTRLVTGVIALDLRSKTRAEIGEIEERAKKRRRVQARERQKKKRKKTRSGRTVSFVSL